MGSKSSKKNTVLNYKPTSKNDESNGVNIAALLLANADISFVIDRKGVFLESYSANNSLLYVAPEKIIGSKISDLLPPEIVSITLSKMASVFLLGNKETYIYSLGGQMYRSTMVKIDNDRVLALISNIEEEISLRANLETTRQNYHQLIEMMPLGLMICEMVKDDAEQCVDFLVKSVNKEYLSIIGDSDIPGKLLSASLQELEAKWFGECLASANGGQPVVRENYDPWRDKWIFTTAYPTDSGEFVVIVTDLGKTAEQRYLIRKSEERFSFAMNHSRSFVWEWSDDTQFSFSPKALSIYWDFDATNYPKHWSKCKIFSIPTICH